jgi:hypothetical protein
MGRRLWAALGFSALAGLAMTAVIGLGAAVLIPLFSSDEASPVALFLLLVPLAAALAAWLAGIETLPYGVPDPDA